MFVYFLLLLKINEVIATIKILDKGFFPLQRDSVALQFYIDVENENRDRPCKVYTRAKKCCLTNQEHNCDPFHVYNENMNMIKPKDRKTIVFIYPTVFQHDKKGFCDFVLKYRCGHEIVKKHSFNITFDTRIAELGKKFNKLRNYIGDKEVSYCDTLDEDSLSECSPVDCNVKYNDEKPYYDRNSKTCIAAVTCVGKLSKGLPFAAYLPDVNYCRDLDHPLGIPDIYAIINGIGVVTEKLKPKPELTAEVKTNCSTISQHLNFLQDLIAGKFCPKHDRVSVDYSKSCKRALLSIVGYVVCISMLIVSCLFCINALMWLLRKWDSGSLRNQCQNLKTKFRRKEIPVIIETEVSPGDSNVKRTLLRDIMIRDIPLELRNSVLDVCERIGKEVKWKKRYRVADLGAVEFERDVRMSEDSSASSSGEVNSDEEKLN